MFIITLITASTYIWRYIPTFEEPPKATSPAGPS